MGSVDGDLGTRTVGALSMMSMVTCIFYSGTNRRGRESNRLRCMRPSHHTVSSMCVAAALYVAPVVLGQSKPAISAVDAARLPASTLLVTNEDQLRGAARLSGHTDINILIDRKIVSKGGIVFPKSNSVVRVLGVGESAEIHFDMRFDGNWSAAGFRSTNGFEFHCRQAIMRGVIVSGYEWLGSAIKGHVSELLDISKCRFEDIGTIQFPHKTTPPKIASDTLYNQVIGAHHLWTAHVSISNCVFVRCALNNHRWTHCIYTSAGSVSVTDNVFSNCGNPFCVSGGNRRGGNLVCGNKVKDPRPVEDANGIVRPPFLAIIAADCPAVFAFNEIHGLFSSPWTGQPDPTIHYVDFNDYSEMSYTRAWASDTGRGVSLSFEQWRDGGFDVHSSAPRSIREERKALQDANEASE